MRLFIAEKPELAKAIVEGLGGGTRKNGFYDCGADYVTWCYGHMLQLLDPEDYDEKYSIWKMSDLPIAHVPWRKKPSNDKKDQLKIIVDLIKKADTVVNAGDPDDEGQLLVDEILQYANCCVPVKRVLINDNNTKVVRKALDNMRDNSEFAGSSSAAEARGVGDQLYGYNLTRAYTLSARNVGYQGVLSVGRVQTPILGLVVRRDREFSSHIKNYYYNVTGKFDIEGITFPARYQTIESDPVDEKGRLTDPTCAQAIVDLVKGKPAKIISAETKQKEQNPPLPYNLLKLQTDASRKFGFKPDKVKDITQALREKHKLITYNRSDCEYLSEEQHGDAEGVLSAIAGTAPVLAGAAQKADPVIKSRAFNSAKVSAHHAIIPTETIGDFSQLSDDEQKIYLLIARAYIAQFWPKHKYDQTDVVVEVEGKLFACRSNVTVFLGWKSLYKNDAGNEDLDGNEDDLDLETLRNLRTNQNGTCNDAVSDKMETKPQPLYTMATLLTDLTRVAKYVRDDRLRAILIAKDKGKEGEHGGIGTPATRDTIIATLFERGYLTEKGKNIVSTKTGQDFYDTLPDQAKYPDMTALWHEQQKAIERQEITAESFITELVEYISTEVENVKQNGIGISVKTFACPDCNKPLRLLKKKDSKQIFWGCTGYAEGCKFACDDKAGQPNLAKKDAQSRAKAGTSSTHSSGIACPACGKDLAHRTGLTKPAARGMKGKPYDFYSCTGYPKCSAKFNTGPDGKPIFSDAKKAAGE